MSQKLFASVYIDECLSPILAELIRKKGFNAVSCYEINFISKSDEQQLSNAILRRNVFVTRDKKDFYKNLSLDHKGIILVTPKLKIKDLTVIADKITKFLNMYTTDEFENLTLFV